MPLAELYIGYARQDEPVTETRGDGKYFLSLRAGRDHRRRAGEEHARAALRL